MAKKIRQVTAIAAAATAVVKALDAVVILAKHIASLAQ